MSKVETNNKYKTLNKTTTILSKKLLSKNPS